MCSPVTWCWRKGQSRGTRTASTYQTAVTDGGQSDSWAVAEGLLGSWCDQMFTGTAGFILLENRIKIFISDSVSATAASTQFQCSSRSWHLEANSPTDILGCEVCVCASAGSPYVCLCVTPKSTVKFKGRALPPVIAYNQTIASHESPLVSASLTFRPGSWAGNHSTLYTSWSGAGRESHLVGVLQWPSCAVRKSTVAWWTRERRVARQENGEMDPNLALC